MPLGSHVKKYRKALGFTLGKLAERSQVDVGTLGAMEIRDSARSEFIDKIAQALCLTVEELLDESADHSVIAKTRHEAEFQTGAPMLREERKPYRVTVPARPIGSSVTPSQWTQLDAREQALVEAYIRGL